MFTHELHGDMVSQQHSVGTKLVQQVLILAGFYQIGEEGDCLRFLRDSDSAFFEIPRTGKLPQPLLENIAKCLEIPPTYEGFQSECLEMGDEAVRQIRADNWEE